MNEQPVRSVETDALQIAYVEHGPTNGWSVILSHGFPYDVHAFDEVASILAREGARVIAPYRGRLTKGEIKYAKPRPAT
jgi:pimeloyl-ACP methyl ester carboxylesterase